MTNNEYCVYCHTSPSGKKYIGVTRRNPIKRWNYGKGYKENSYFTNAINKYGWDSFRHEILFSGLSECEASEKEKELIKEFRTTDRQFGYNIEPGGLSTSKQIPEETRKKISDSLRGKFTDAQREAIKTRRNPHYHHSEEMKKIIGDSHRGKPLSEEHKKKLSESHIGIKPTNLEQLRKCNMKPVEKLDTNGNLICTYPSITDAAKDNFVTPCCIGACCNGHLKTAAGFKWRFADD